MENRIRDFFDFIEECPSPYHTVQAVAQRLERAGYTYVPEAQIAQARAGGKFYTTRAATSLIALSVPPQARGFMICAAHTDSPSFRVKYAEGHGVYARLTVEKYGGGILPSWLDRPLGAAGLVSVRAPGGVRAVPINLGNHVAIIPGVAPHMDRAIADGAKLNIATDMPALFGDVSDAATFVAQIAQAAGVEPADVLSHDLRLYNGAPGVCAGARQQYLICPRLDDLCCVYAATEGICGAPRTHAVQVCALFDSEEIGSATRQGAASAFLCDTLRAVAQEHYPAMLAHTLMLSADNAHAKHPNHPEYAEEKFAPVLGGGIVIKVNTAQKYATDPVGDALLRLICEREGIPVQWYYNRADIPGGATLGAIVATGVPVPVVDMGIAQLSMHSAAETAAVADIGALRDTLRAFYKTEIRTEKDTICL